MSIKINIDDNMLVIKHFSSAKMLQKPSNNNIKSARLNAIPTNIITGFLGVGKTTAILHLLQTKPANERWAVLVNEFGEVGIDGSLMSGQLTEHNGIFISEVSGGCMCCAAGVPMQIALKTLLLKAQPDRLLIEPTGLGHPKEIIKILTAEHNLSVINLLATVTLVDARNIKNPRYTTHDTFNQQLDIADIVIGNKAELYEEQDKANLSVYLQEKYSKEKPLYFTEHGKLNWQWLSNKTNYQISSKQLNDKMAVGRSLPLFNNDNNKAIKDQPLPSCGYIRIDNQGEGFYSSGWRFSAKFIFSREKIQQLLTQLAAERVKAIFHTVDGVFSYNNTLDSFTENQLINSTDSRIEIITKQPLSMFTQIAPKQTSFEQCLLNCVLDKLSIVVSNLNPG